MATSSAANPAEPSASAPKSGEKEASLTKSPNCFKLRFWFSQHIFFCIELNWFQAASKLCEIKFEDFASYDRSHYKILISRCQQLALDKCGAAVPLPADQLAMANQKKDKEPRSYHGRWQHFLFFVKVLCFKVLVLNGQPSNTHELGLAPNTGCKTYVLGSGPPPTHPICWD